MPPSGSDDLGGYTLNDCTSTAQAVRHLRRAAGIDLSVAASRLSTDAATFALLEDGYFDKTPGERKAWRKDIVAAKVATNPNVILFPGASR